VLRVRGSAALYVQILACHYYHHIHWPRVPLELQFMMKHETRQREELALQRDQDGIYLHQILHHSGCLSI
jgi:hypothetical protein